MHHLRCLLGDTVIHAVLQDTPATRDLLALLPLDLPLTDFAATEKIADLPSPLSTRDAPSGYQPRAGDIAYYIPWGNLAIFYRDGGYARGLVALGRITEGIEWIHGSKVKSLSIERAHNEQGHAISCT
ncbi:MAG: cyclophilin-like fold protein [Alcanivorax sp.]|nr:cyclophilin-like fold protein [Alcanivorax sp.]